MDKNPLAKFFFSSIKLLYHSLYFIYLVSKLILQQIFDNVTIDFESAVCSWNKSNEHFFLFAYFMRFLYSFVIGLQYFM